jgi:toxin HigB-1
VNASIFNPDFRHKGLPQLFKSDSPKRVNAEHVRKPKQILALMQVAERIEDLEVPTFRRHALRGDRKGWRSIAVRRNWRVVFRFANGTALDIDLVEPFKRRGRNHEYVDRCAGRHMP